MTEPVSLGRRKNDRARAAGKIPIRLKGASSWTALTTLLFCVGSLIAGGVLYYSYVKDHEASLTKRHFRNLETIGRNLSEATNAYEQMIGAGAESLRMAEFPKLSKDQHSFVEDQRCFAKDFVRVRGKLPTQIIERAIKQLRTYTPWFAYLCAGSKLSDVWLSLDVQQRVAIPLRYFQNEKANRALSLALDDGYEFKSLDKKSLQFMPPADDREQDSQRYRITPKINGNRGLRLEKGLGRSDKKIGNLADCPDCTLTLHARFEPNLEELVRPETFAEVFVADESGNVIVHRSDKEQSTDTRFEQLDRLLRADTVPPTLGSPSQSTDSDKQKGSLWDQLPLRKTVRLGDADYYLYAQAVPIDSDLRAVKQSEREAGRLKLIVAGLVPVSEVLWSALTIPHGVSLTLIFISFALTFTLPLIKLATMGPRDRLGLTDALGCMLFLLMGTALLAFTIGSWTLHDHVKTEADGRLKSAADAIQNNYAEELRKLVTRLDELRKGRLDSSKDMECADSVSPNSGHETNRVCVSLRDRLPLPDPLPDPLILTTLWIDPLGDIRHSETIRRYSLVTKNLRARSYMREVWTGSLRSIRGDDGKPIKFSIEPIFSWDDGEFGTMLAMPAIDFSPAVAALVKSAREAYSPKDFVVAVRTRMRSLVNTVVPVGYGYAVIDKDGKVLYASDKNRNLRENLFSETDNDPQLKSLAGSHTSGMARVNYRGRAHIMYITRLNDFASSNSLAWTLVVYRDTRWLDWVTDQALFFGVELFTGYSLVILVVGLFVLIIFQSVRSGEGGWMWPAEGRSRTYVWLMVSNALFLLLAIHIVHKWSTAHPVRVSLGAAGLACLAMGIMVVMLKVVSSEKMRNDFLNQKKLYEQGCRTLAAIGGMALSKLWTGPADQRVVWNTKTIDPYERGGLSPQARWAYSGLVTTAILVMAAMPSASFLTIGFQRALSLYESHAVGQFYQQSKDRKEESVQWTQRTLGRERFTKFQQPTEYRAFLLDCNPSGAVKSERELNLTAQPPEWFKERTRSLLHLWMWVPGKTLGGWVGHSVDHVGNAASCPLIPAEALDPSSLMVAVILVVGAVLGYARICEDTRLKGWMVGLAVGAGAACLGVLIYRAEMENGEAWTRFPGPLVGYIAVGCALLTAITYACQRIAGHYLFLMDFAEPLVSRESATSVHASQPLISPGEVLTGQLLEGSATKRVLIVLPPEGTGLTVPGIPPVNESRAAGDKSAWNVLSIPALLKESERSNDKSERSDEVQHQYISDETLPLALKGFGHRLSERHQAVRMLKLMERLALQPDRAVLVIAHRHPFDPEIVSFESSDIPVQDRSSVFSRDRWAEAFKDFLVIPFSGFEDETDYISIVAPILKGPALLTGENPDDAQKAKWADWGKKVMEATCSEMESRTRYALGVLRCRYEYWWADCTPSEKLALWHVATDRFLHATNSKLYPSLWKGLLKLEPDIKVRDKSFHQFVKQAGDRDELALLRHDLKPSTWAKVSRPLLLGLLSAVVFLSVTQENIRDVVIAFAPVLPAFLIEIPRLLGGNIRAAISKDV